MTCPFRAVDPAGLKSALHDGGEIALLDAPEEVTFDTRHLLMAACVPLSVGTAAWREAGFPVEQGTTRMATSASRFSPDDDCVMRVRRRR